MEGSTGVGGVLPRRRAAKTAMAIFAGQLDSDSADSHSAGSDAEAESPTRKGRPTAAPQSGNVTKTRKRAATMKGDLPHAGTGSKDVRSAGPSTSRSMPSPSAPLIITAPEDPPRPRPRSQPIVKKPTHATLPPLIVPPAVDLGELSDLTPLSSGGYSAISDIIEATKLSTSASTSDPQPSHPKNKLAPKPAKESKRPTWTAASLSPYVWVLIEPKTRRVHDEDGEDDDGESIWWPGKIVSSPNTDIPLKVKLFGLGGTVVSIQTPSDRNVLPRDLDYLPRFLTPTFVSSTPFSTTASSRKRKLEREAVADKWKAAVDAMRSHDELANKDDEMDSDNFPEPTNNMFDFLTGPLSMKSISAPPTINSLKNKGQSSVPSKRKRKQSSVSDTDTDEDNGAYVNKKKDKKGEDWWDEVDEDLKLPGELVLGRTGQPLDIDHWPGKLIEYIPPTKPKTFGKYSILWLDGANSLIPRSWFYSTDQDEFATCKLGEFDSAIVEVQNDEEDDKFHPAVELSRRIPSPIPLATPPSGPQFSQLSIREQFVYTKGVLKAILNDEYAPVRERQARYMKGGKHRQSLVDGASLRGKMDPRDVNDLLAYVREWCLRDGGRAGALCRDNDPISSNQSVNEIETGDDVVRKKAEIREMQVAVMEASFDDVNEPDGMRVPSSSPTAGFTSSPQMPPSSFPSAALKREASIISILSDVEIEKESLNSISSPPAMSIATEPGIVAITNEAIDEDVNDLTTLDEDPAIQLPPSLPKQRGSSTFEFLSDLEKVDYCLNILLPEAVRQILLWRNGSRTSVELLSHDDEQDLYDEGTKLLEETDWVNDVIRYRKGLQMILSKGKVPETSRREMGRRTRLRRNIVMPNYQE